MLKVAFLILAHHQPGHLARLVRSISADWNDIYIHIDKKSELDSFVSRIDNLDTPSFLTEDQRIDVRWGGFSIVEATLSLLSAAYQSDQLYGRFCLLSGADFPIKPINQIKKAFATEVEFMRIDRHLSPEAESSHARYVNYHHFVDSNSLADRGLSGKIARQPYDRIEHYHGSAWWSLTRECIDYIIDFLADNPDYTEYHRTTLCPDEIYFHSIVKGSPFANKLSHDCTKQPDQEQFNLLNEHGCHYIDWNANSRKLPKILNAGDLYFILKTGMLFARKFDVKTSSSLLDEIEIFCGTETRLKNKIKNTLVVFQTHLLTGEIMNEYRKIKAVEDQQISVKLFYDNSLLDFDPTLFQSEDEYYLFDAKNTFDYIGVSCQSGNFYGNANLPLIYFSSQHPEYEYYWVIEYDVRFTGDWSSFFNSFIHSDSDLLGTTLCSYAYCTDWTYWHSIKPPSGDIALQKLIRGFFPVVRYSRKACQLLSDAYIAGWRGHFEALVPTVLSLKGCTIEDIGGNCEYTPFDRCGLFYTNSPKNEALAPGTFRFQPAHKMPLRIPDMLYHPVKPEQWDEMHQSSMQKRAAYKNSALGQEIGDKRYIFVISHMRSYSSLLCHLLGSHKDISGYAESNLSYDKPEDVYRLHEAVRKMTDSNTLSRYVLDKVLHGYYCVPDTLLADSRCRFVFMLREPVETIQSILYMICGDDSHAIDESLNTRVIDYYNSRLKEMVQMSRHCNDNALFIDSRDLIEKPKVILSELTDWLDLSYPLKEEYKIFPYTGVPNYGDPSEQIKKGRIEKCADNKEYIDLSLDALEGCFDTYKRCREALKFPN